MNFETQKLIEKMKKYYNVNDLSELNKNQWKEISGTFDGKWNNRLTEEFIEKYSDKVNWQLISKYQKLSEPFIEKHANKLNMEYISQYQNLSEEFLEKNRKTLPFKWGKICQYQKLSADFIRKYQDTYIAFKGLSLNENLTPEIIEEFKDRLDWYYLSSNPVLTYEGLIDRYADRIYFSRLKNLTKLDEKLLLKHVNKIELPLFLSSLEAEKKFNDIPYSKEFLVDFFLKSVKLYPRFKNKENCSRMLNLFELKSIKDIILFKDIISVLEQNSEPDFPRNYKRSALVKTVFTQKRWTEYLLEKKEEIKKRISDPENRKNLFLSEVLKDVETLTYSLNVDKEELMETVKKAIKKLPAKKEITIQR